MWLTVYQLFSLIAIRLLSVVPRVVDFPDEHGYVKREQVATKTRSHWYRRPTRVFSYRGHHRQTQQSRNRRQDTEHGEKRGIP